MDIDAPENILPPRLTFDPEWLAVVRAFDPYMTLTENQHGSHPDHQAAIEAVSRELEWIKQNLLEGGRQDINDVQTFVTTATGPTPETQEAKGQQRGVTMFSKPRRMLTYEQPIISRTPKPPRFVPCYKLTTRQIV